MTCLVGTPSIEATTTSCNRNDETISQTDTSQETDFASHLRFFASRTPLTPTSVQDKHPSPKYWTPTLTPLDTDPIRWPNILNGNLPADVKCLPQRSMNPPDTTYCDSCTPQYIQWECEDTGNQTGLPAIMEVSVLRIQFFALNYSLFCNIPQTTDFFYFCRLYSTGISPLYFQTIPPWPLPRPLSPLRPRLSSRLVRRVVQERTTVRSLRLTLSLLLQDIPPER